MSAAIHRHSWLPKLLLVLAASLSAADEPAAKDHVLRGVVKDREGKPVAAAKVWALSSQLFGGTDQYDTDQTDADGCFTLTIPARWLEGIATQRQELAIVAYCQGHGIGGLVFYREASLPDEPLEILLPPVANMALEILAPDGKPLAGAMVKPATFQCDTIYTTLTESQAKQQAKQWRIEARQTPWGIVASRFPAPLPPEISTALSAKTDDRGRATLTTVSPADLYGIAVETQSHSTQNFSRLTPFASAEPLSSIKLLPLAELTGELKGSPEDVGGRKIRLISYPAAPAGTKIYGNMQQTVTTDAEGKFRTAIMEGTIIALPEWDIKSPLRPVPPEQFAARAGAKNHLEIPIVDAVKVYGYVRDAATGKGIPGIHLGVASWIQSEPLVTDENGRYETMSAPGTSAALPTNSTGWIPANKTPTLTQEKISGKEFELKPILLHRAVVLTGTVVDEEGQSVPDAKVQAAWLGYSHTLSRDDLNSAAVKTAANGSFTIGGIDPASECRVTAEKGTAFTSAVQIVKGQAPPLTLSVSDKNGVRLEGRVVDAAGKPVAGAKLQLWHQPWRPDYYDAASDRANVPAGDDWKTDSAGRFTSPALRPDGKYRVSLVDPRYEPSQTAWLDAASGKVPPLDDLLARKLGEHLGTVADRDGKPIAGAKVVFQGGGKRIEGDADDQGKFKLSPAPDGPGMLFVSKEGFRFHGRRLNTFGQPLSIKLATVGQPYGEKLEVKPPTISIEKRRELACKLADDLIKQIGLDLSGEQRMQVLMELAKADPQAALDRVEKKQFLVPMMNDAVRFQASRTMMADSAEEALELIDGLTTFPHMQVMTYAEIAAALPAEKRDRKLEILAEALVKAQAIKEPGFRLASIAKVGEALLDAGEKERGKKLLLENAESAKKLNKAGYDAFLRGMYAEELAQVDLETALAMVKEINDYGEKTRHLGNIAHELAAIDPAQAERVLESMPPPPADSRIIWSKDSDAVKVCYRMAKVDLPRAVKIAGGCADPFHKAHAHGAIAVAIAKSDARQAADYMRLAFESLDEAAHPGRELPVSAGNFGNVGGWLVWQAQQIDPELGAEMLWRLLAVLPEEPNADPQKTWRDTEGLSSAAMFLSLMDESLARTLLTRLERSQNLAYSRTWLPAWGLVDPEKAFEKASAPADQANPGGRRAQLIGAMAATGEQRLKTIHYNAGLWRIDVEDLDQ